MNILITLLLPYIEKQLVNLEPQMEEFIVNEIKAIGDHIINWAQGRVNNKDK